MRLSGRKPILFNRPWTRRQRIVLLGLIGANMAGFVIQRFLEAWEPGFTKEFLGLSNHGVGDAYSWQFLTAMFLHNGILPFAGNMLVLYFLGRDVESILGQKHFLYLYLSGVVTGELLHLFVMPPESVLFAASGGAAALVAANAAILPELEIISPRFLGFSIKSKHLACVTIVFAGILIYVQRNGVVTHTGYLGGCVAGWFYAHLLGFGRTSFLQRHLQRRRVASERFLQLSPEQLITEEIDPLLDKIAHKGIHSLSRSERRRLTRARERILEEE
jgi:membrane associated rhomboid family serine protease